MRRTRNEAYGQPYRGFKSLPLRQIATDRAQPDLREIIVLADLAAFEGDLKAVERPLVAISEAERRTGRRRQRQPRRQGVDAELIERVARRVAAGDDGSG